MILKTADNALVMSDVGQLCMIVSGRKPFTDETWSEYCLLCKKFATETKNVSAVFNFSPIVGPSAPQRKKFTTELAEENKNFKRVVLVSDSPLVRGALTATAWLSGSSLQMRAFSPTQVEQGLYWLQEKAEFRLEAARELLKNLVRQQGDDPMGLLS